MAAPETQPLQELARLYGIETAYDDVDDREQQAASETLLAVLASLGAPIARPDDAPLAIQERRQAIWQQPLEPVSVAWEGERLRLKVRLPSDLADVDLTGNVTLESGEEHSWQWRGDDAPVLEAAEVGGCRYVMKSLPLPGDLPRGYHRFTLELPGRQEETFIIAAPAKAYSPPDGSRPRTWGIFLPSYALHTGRSWGTGDFSDLEDLIEWVAGIGGSVVATLPLLAAFLDDPFEPSPYAPASRLLWNTLYVDATRVPELQECPAAKDLLESSSFQAGIDALRNQHLADYREQMALKRRIMEELAECVFASNSDRLQSLMRFAEAHPEAGDYARFRAASEKHCASWTSWPKSLRRGDLRDGDYDDKTRRYHLYAQWLADEQFQAVSDTARRNDVQLYLDLPLGVHPESYDVWRHQDLFVQQASGGAPPDTFFREGQNWSFPPLHPEIVRRRNYDYVIACLRHSLRHADILRVDHVMSLHRLFWIPKGMEASRGVYVRYAAEELYAILALESHRNQAVIVGEDLGTVPPEVRPSMARHGLHRMYVMQYQLNSDSRKALPAAAPDMVASVNTHDMPPFAAFWQGLDIERGSDREGRDALKHALVSFLRHRGWDEEPSTADTHAVLRAALGYLGTCSARMLLVNLEDLWLETEAQNVPGTQDEYPNWRRKARHSFEVFRQLPQVVDILRDIDRSRNEQ